MSERYLPELNPDNELCARCGKVADGMARGYDGERLCHGNDPYPTCYMKQGWDRTFKTGRFAEAGQ